MPELYLQSDMLNNMGLSQQQLMMQRGNMYRNYQMGAFLSDTSGEHLAGTRVANPYLRYYAQMQRDAMEYQRRVALQQQMMQRQMAVQQHEFMLRQQHEENQIQRSEKERQDKLLEIRKRRERIQNDPKFSTAEKKHYEKEALLEEANLGDAAKLFTYTYEESGYFYPDNYPVKEKRGKPILNKIQLDNETGQEVIVGVPAKELYQDYQAKLKDDRAHNLAREKEDREKAEAFAKALTPSPAEKKKADDEAEAKKPWRWEELGDDEKTRVIPKQDKSRINKEADAEAADWYAGKQRLTSTYKDAEGEPGRQNDMDKQFHEEALDILRDDTKADPEGVREYRERARKKRFTDDFTYDDQGTGEMFAAQDPGMGQDMFSDPGMDFDPVDETYTLDEIA